MAWFAAFHVVGLVIWLGGLLDLTRLMGYHVKEDVAVQERLSWMEFRMFWFVATPGMLITVIMGLFLFFYGGGVETYLKGAGWFHAKLTLVCILLVIHFVFGKMLMQQRAEPKIVKAGKFKAIHGVVGLLFISILILVFVRPF